MFRADTCLRRVLVWHACRHDIFSAAQKRELETAIRESKEFQYLFTDRDKGRPKAPSSSKSPAAGGQPDEQQQRVPLARGDRGQQQQQALSRPRQELQRGDRGKSDSPSGKGASAAARGSGRGVRGSSPTAAAAAPAAPPPPEPPAESSPQQQQQQLPQPPAVTSGKPAPAAAATAANRSSIKIVVNSTAVGAGSSAAAAAGGWQQQMSPGDSPAAAGEGGRGSIGSGLSGAKRGAVEIRDLDADDDDFGAAGDAGGEHASKRARVQQQGHMANGGREQQQRQPEPWESEEHRRAVENGTLLQVFSVRCKFDIAHVPNMSLLCCDARVVSQSFVGDFCATWSLQCPHGLYRTSAHAKGHCITTSACPHACPCACLVGDLPACLPAGCHLKAA